MIFSRLDLRGARVLLTGASSGIGRALAYRLGQQKARLVLASRGRQRLVQLADELRASGGEAFVAPADVADAAQRARLLEQAVTDLGGLDILINNAGVGALGFFAGADEARLRRIMEVNFFAATELTRVALPHLRQGRNPMIVNVASVLGRRAIPGMVEYCASKFAMVGWAEGLRAELARDGVHVLLVCPGGVETEFDANMIEKRARLTWRNRRRMSPDRCARLVVGAMRARKNEVVITASGKLMLLANRVAPRLLDWVLARMAKDVAAGTGEPAP